MFEVGAYVTPDLFGEAVYQIVAKTSGVLCDIKDIESGRLTRAIHVSEEHGWYVLPPEEARLPGATKPKLVMTAYGSAFQGNVKAALKKAKIPFRAKSSDRRGSVDFLVREGQFLAARKAIDDYYAKLNGDNA